MVPELSTTMASRAGKPRVEPQSRVKRMRAASAALLGWRFTTMLSMTLVVPSPLWRVAVWRVEKFLMETLPTESMTKADLAGA